jgi:hypothetical protein
MTSNRVGRTEAATGRDQPAEAHHLRAAVTGSGRLISGVVLCVVLVSLDVLLPTTAPTASASRLDLAFHRLSVEPLRLGLAALIGLVITGIYRRGSHDPQAQTLAHAQILLCVAGAMMMALINDSLARAFGIAGAASIIRFRTPVDDPKNAVVLFLLMGLGMACGLGALTLAGAGAAMLCVFLVLLEGVATERTRTLLVELVANGPTFPVEHVLRVFGAHRVRVELREMSQDDPARAKHLAFCGPETGLETLNADLLAGGSGGLRAIAWEPAGKKAL